MLHVWRLHTHGTTRVCFCTFTQCPIPRFHPRRAWGRSSRVSLLPSLPCAVHHGVLRGSAVCGLLHDLRCLSTIEVLISNLWYSRISVLGIFWYMGVELLDYRVFKCSTLLHNVNYFPHLSVSILASSLEALHPPQSHQLSLMSGF